MARSCFIFCIGGSEGLFLIASIFGPSALRIGSICIFCFGVSLSCCDNACIFAAGSVVWPGAAGTRVKKTKRQAADIRNVKGFFMAALCLASHDWPAKTTNSLYRLDLGRPPGLGEARLLLAVEAQKISYTLSASTGTPSHFAAAARSVNSETCSGEWSVNMACNFA